MIQPHKSHLTTLWIIDHLKKGETVSFKVRGHSMRPSLNDGDWITLSSQGSFLRGDLVLIGQLDPPECLHVHRLHFWSTHTVRTKGDALPYFDPCQPRTHLLARVVQVKLSSSSSLTKRVKSHFCQKPSQWIYRMIGLLYSYFYTGLYAVLTLFGVRAIWHSIKVFLKID